MAKHSLSAVLVAIAMSGPAFAGAFINGGFENGTTSGWTTAGGYRGSISNTTLNRSDLTGTTSRSEIIAAGTVDPNVGLALGSTVYGGTYSYRVEDTTNGGYASLVEQTVLNYTDSNIFFAWKAVLENGGHTANESATMIIELKDLTTNQKLISRIYNAGGGTDTRFQTLGSFYFTPDWQIEQLAIDATLSGHNFLLSVLAADCQPTGHTGYVYLDGFGAQNPIDPNPVPEPASLGLLGAGMAGLALARRRARG